MAVADVEKVFSKSSNEILDEIFKDLEEKSSSHELELNGNDLVSTILKKCGSSGKDSTSKKSEKHKSSKHHKKHKKHHKHKHKKSEEERLPSPFGGDGDGSKPTVDELSVVKSAEDPAKPLITDVKSEASKAVLIIDGDRTASTLSKSMPNDTVIVETQGLDIEVRRPTERENGAVAKRVSEVCDEQVPSKRAKTETSSSPLNVNVPSEREDGEVSEAGDSAASDAGSPANATKWRDETPKKHKKSKHKKKKKKKSKEIKRFTSPLTLTLTSRSRKLSLASPTSRSRSRSRSKDRPSSRDRSPKPRGFRRRRRSRSMSAERRRRPSLRVGTPINKVQLLEIARKNAMAMMAEGRLPAGLTVPSLEKDQVVAIKSGGKSLAELNDFCKLLSKKESEGSGEASDEDKSLFIHHPFKPRDHQPNIVLNIRNSVQIPVKTAAEKVAEGSKLRIQFPVSSGSQHRKKEGEWVPVSPDKEEISKSSCTAMVPLTAASASAAQPAVLKKPVSDPKAPLALPAPPIPQPMLPPAPPPPPPFLPPADSVFPVPTASLQKLDIGSIVSQRLRAVRKLKDNPHDIEALCQMYKSQQEMSTWAQSKQLPGQFTGSTDARILTPQQLAGPAHLQAWVKKDQFSRVAPVQGGVGMQMLQRMGWKPGEGLGKNKEGQAEPIILDIKLDKKGLVSQDEIHRNNNNNNRKPNTPGPKDISGKHPVSALVELCNKWRWGAPNFTMVFDSGPDHKKNFVFKVKVNGIEYQPTIASLNKKQAKAQCAMACLQALGILPKDYQLPG